MRHLLTFSPRRKETTSVHICVTIMALKWFFSLTHTDKGMPVCKKRIVFASFYDIPKRKTILYMLLHEIGPPKQSKIQKKCSDNNNTSLIQILYQRHCN